MMDYNKELNKFKMYLLSCNLSINTVKEYEKDVKQYFLFCMNTSYKAYSKSGVYHFLLYLMKKNQNKNKRSTVARKRSSLVKLSYYYHSLYKEHFFDFDIIKSPKKENYYPDFYKNREIKLILEKCDLSLPTGKRDYIIILFLFSTGLRAQELLDLKFNSINLNTGKVLVYGKGRKERIVYLPDKILLQLINYYQIFKEPIQKYNCWFFNFYNKPLSYSGLYYICKRIEKQLYQYNLHKNIHPHGFRHSFGTSMVHEGIDIRIIGEFLGHISLDTTQKYTHMSPEFLKKSFNEHSHIFNSVLS